MAMVEQAIAAKIVEGRIWLSASFADKDKCKAIPGARAVFDKKINRFIAWSYPATQGAALRIKETFGGRIEWDETCQHLIQQAAQLSIAAEGIRNDPNPPAIMICKTEPWKHQRQAFHFLKDFPSAYNGLKMGEGKSKVSIDLIQNKGFRRVLIIAPNAVVAHWPKQFKNHYVGKYSIIALDSEAGSIERRTQAAENYLDMIADEPDEGCAAVVLNMEGFWRKPIGDWIKRQDWDCVVFDEIHRLKAAGGKASNFAADIAWLPSVKYRIGLSGTPLAHCPLDIYGQYRILDPGIFGTSYKKFCDQYAIFGGYQNRQVIDYKNMDDLNKRMFSIMYRAEDVDLQLPPIQMIDREFKLSGEARRVYDELEDAMMTEIEGKEITVGIAITKMLKLAQITGGFIYEGQGKDKKAIRFDHAKRDMLIEILSDLDPSEPVVVFGRFQPDLDEIREACSKIDRGYLELSGRFNQLAQWQEGGAPIIGVQQKSGGVGVELFRAAYAIFFSVEYSLADYEQAIKRLHRPGQDRPVKIIHLLAKGTIDRKIYSALEKRKEIVEYVLSGDCLNEQ